jgi:hypothetical protein
MHSLGAIECVRRGVFSPKVGGRFNNHGAVPDRHEQSRDVHRLQDARTNQRQ